ncbi:MAG: PAS domain S-box protein [Candidatus Cloacimonetes bacterium]|nr:PAS domain S-box protein [Candidatus Cloacimonadota bacterium]
MKKINNPNKKRILIIDDNIHIHQDFKKVLLISKDKETDFDQLEQALLGKTSNQLEETYMIDCASQGEEGLKMIEESLRKKEPYAVAFVDVRMPPGWDGVKTISKIWEIYPDIQIVICTAYSDYSWDELFNKFGNTDKLLILKKPFDNIEVRQITQTLSKKWELNLIANLKMNELERNVQERTKELQHSEEKYRTMIENSNDMIWTLDTKGNFLYANKKSEDITGYKLKDGMGKPFIPIILEEDLEMVQNIFLDTLKGNSNHYEIRIHDVTQKKIITLSVNTAPIVKDEKIVGTVSFGRDITERKQTENKILKLKEFNEAIVTNLSEGIIVENNDGIINFANPAMLRMLGYKNDELVGSHWKLFVPDDQVEIVKCANKRRNRGEFDKYEMELKKKSGERISVLVSGVPLNQNGTYTGLLAAFTDITQLKQAEHALRKSEKQFRLIAENTSDNIAITTFDLKATYQYLSPSLKSMVGYDQKDLLGKSFFNFVHPEDKKVIVPLLKKYLNMKIKKLLTGKESKVSETIEYRFINKAGKWRNFQSTVNLIGKQLITLTRDITERKKAEEAIKIGRERLKMLNKIIRHDLSNDFVVIKSATKIFKATSDVDMLTEIEKRVNKSLETIANYREYEYFIDSNSNLNEVELRKLINNLIVEFPNIKFNIQGNCKVYGDDALGSIFINLITNSIKHGNSSEIGIKISSDRNLCKIKFIDNGIGIPDKIKDKIFNEGFFYGKTGHTGIGLHIVRKTVESYGGSITVKKNKPNGAVFIIVLKKALKKLG